MKSKYINKICINSESKIKFRNGISRYIFITKMYKNGKMVNIHGIYLTGGEFNITTTIYRIYRIYDILPERPHLTKEFIMNIFGEKYAF